jgi:hypothetical protein
VLGHKGRRKGPRYIEVESGCWEWQHALNPQGYAMTGPGKLAHRSVWREIRGALPDEMQLHHRCRNKKCVNPAHMQVVTAQVHRREHARLTAEAVREIRATPWTRGAAQNLAEKFGVARETINSARSGATWSDV